MKNKALYIWLEKASNRYQIPVIIASSLQVYVKLDFTNDQIIEKMNMDIEFINEFKDALISKMKKIESDNEILNDK